MRAGKQTEHEALFASSLHLMHSSILTQHKLTQPIGPSLCSANAAFVALLHAKHTSDASVRSACLSWAQRQLDYMLGLAGSER